MQTIPVDQIPANMIRLISDDWMLVAAGEKGNANSMTANWGFFGHIWFKDVAVCLVRPQRYTYQFVEDNPNYSLSFFERERYRDVLNQYGSRSGRDINKVEGGLLTPAYRHNTLYYQEARLVIFCRKIYKQDLKEAAFIDKELMKKCYREQDFHRAYYGEIIEVLITEQ